MEFDDGQIIELSLDSTPVYLQEGDDAKRQPFDMEIGLKDILGDFEKNTWASDYLDFGQYMQFISDQVKTVQDFRRRRLLTMFEGNGYDPMMAEEMVENLMSGLLKCEDIKLNADADVPIDEINRIVASSSSKGWNCLVINAVAEEVCKTQADQYGFLDTPRRMEEINSFYEQMHKATGQELRSKGYVIEVRCRKDVETALKIFFGCDGRSGIASEASTSIVLVIGHGSKEGLCLLEDPPLLLDEFLTLTKRLWSDAEQIAYNLPAICEVILSQCHAHLYNNQVKCDRFRVRHMTSDKYFTTTSIKIGKAPWKNRHLERAIDNSIGPQHVLDLKQRLAAQSRPTTDTLTDEEMSVDSGLQDDG